MSRGMHNIKQGDVAKALKAAVKSGVKDWRVEIVDGKIVISSGKGDDPVDQGGRGEWD